jgi:hypothetical protein
MSDNNRRSLYELVRVYGGERRYLDHGAEVEALGKAVFDMGLSSFEAECLLMGGAEAVGVALESRVDRVLEVLVRASADRKGRIDRDSFKRIVRYAQALTNEALDESKAEAKVKRIVERLKLTPRKRGPLRSARWFRRAGRTNGAGKSREA